MGIPVGEAAGNAAFGAIITPMPAAETLTKTPSPRSAPFKGRGAVGATLGRFETLSRAAFDDLQSFPPDADADAAPGAPETVIHWDLAKSVVTENKSPDIPHALSANPYRGCEHGCVYCFARPTHSYLGLSPGLDFETQIFAKRDAPRRLREYLRRRGHAPRPLALGIITDAYQPAEKKLKITRAMLEVLAEARHPVSLITKSALIERDLDIITDMAKDNLVETAVSITSLDADLTRKLEPRAASPARRLRVIRALAEAGAPVSVLMAPIIPAATDGEIESLLQAAAEAGATGAGYVVLRLPHELREVFADWLAAHMPLRAQKVMAQVRELHGGKDYNAKFFARHRGTGVLADLIAARFARAKKRFGLDHSRLGRLRCDLFRPPSPADPPHPTHPADPADPAQPAPMSAPDMRAAGRKTQPGLF